MKNYLLSFTCMFLFLSLLQAQHRGVAVGGDVISALQTGSTTMLAPYIDSRTDLWYQSQLKAGAAETILFALKRFFEQNPCSRLAILNEGSMQGLTFVKTAYTAQNGKQFTITLYIRNRMFKRIRIDES